jgi:hypothetical protein
LVEIVCLATVKSQGVFVSRWETSIGVYEIVKRQTPPLVLPVVEEN